MEKACPVVIRGVSDQLDVLAFRHPLAGKQFVKGTIETGEPLAIACERELEEESGLSAKAEAYLGECFIECQGLTYGFYQMKVTQPVPEQFEHFCADDGGHVFEFFWQPLQSELDEEWHPIFHEIRAYLLKVLS